MISVCMPYWFRQEALDESLAAYRKLYPHLDLEFSIADDGSHPGVKAEGCTVTRLPDKPIAFNPCVPLNAAVRASKGDIIVLTNPEILHTENVLDDMLAALTDEMDYVTASCWDDKLGWLAGPNTDYAGGGRWPIPPDAHFHFCAVFHRSLFDKVGGFDEAYRWAPYGDDADFLWKLFVAGAHFKHVDKAVKHTKSERTEWFGDPNDNFALLCEKWGRLQEFMWSDSAHMMRMKVGWQGGLSDNTVCGSGSTLAATRQIRHWLPRLVEDYDIRSLADAGAGDLRWIRLFGMPGVDYRPYDLFPRDKSVKQIDITKEALPRAHAILCRHVLIHLDPPRVQAALRLFQQSARYLIASHYPFDKNEFNPGTSFNKTNLADAPYGLGEPLDMVEDTLEPGCRLAIWDFARSPRC